MLNNNFVGESRKTAEMILITASKPDEILGILHEKYDRPGHIVEELLRKSHQLSVIENLDSFTEFRSTIRNIAAVLEGDLAKLADQKH